MRANTKIHRFFEVLEDTFVGEKIEGRGGYVNLLSVKSDYFSKRVRPELERLIEDGAGGSPELREEILDKLYDFFHKHLNETGTPLMGLTPYYASVFDRIYGEGDVRLYWKTRNHYYVKSDRKFRSLEVELDGFKVFFDVSSVEHKKGNEKRTLVYRYQNFSKNQRRLILKVYYKEGNKDTKLEDIRREVKKKLGLRRYTEEVPSEEVLRRAVALFERQVKVDYFICKDAEGFLKEQLDLWMYQYLCGLVGHRDTTLWTEKRIGEIQLLKEIAYRTIEWIARFENELLRIWLKPRFVVNSNYVITLDRIGEKEGGIGVVRRLISHENMDRQVEEWVELGIVGEDFDKNRILLDDTDEHRLNPECRFLPVDTRYFKDLEPEILSLFGDLDRELDGWLIKSENFQALNTVLPKFKGKVKTIYIDPPFNKDQEADYHYLVDYKDSTWITMLENRVKLGRDLLSDDGGIFIRCDYNGDMYVRLLMDDIFGKENFRNEIAVRRFKKNVIDKNVKRLPEALDTIYLYAKDQEVFTYTNPYKELSRSREGFWRHMGDSSGQGSPKVFFGREIAPPSGKHWKYSQEKIERLIEEGKLILQCKGCGYVHDRDKGLWKGCPDCGEDNPQPKYWVERKEKEFLDSNWTDIYGYATGWGFRTENSEALLKRVIKSTSEEGDIVMDFFLGSGTTTAVAHKLGRRWIGVEMGEHFYTVILPRMKKVLSYDRSGVSKDKDVREMYNEDKAGGFFKYFELEQYEDILRTIRYNDIGEGHESFPEEYLFAVDEKLLLSVSEDEGKLYFDPSGLYPDKYVDIPETLSCLKGLQIKRISGDRVEFEDGSTVKVEGGKVELDHVVRCLWWR